MSEECDCGSFVMVDKNGDQWCERCNSLIARFGE